MIGHACSSAADAEALLLPQTLPGRNSPKRLRRWVARARAALPRRKRVLAVLLIAPAVLSFAYGASIALQNHIDDLAVQRIVDTLPTLPPAKSRCEWLEETILKRNTNVSREVMRRKFRLQAVDVNMFYRGVDYIFWRDMVANGWGLFNLSAVAERNLRLLRLSPTSTWTWITGDQHLSNFGAWKNRHDDVVFGVNDFDEAVIYDFQMDIWRLAVSMYDHALTNGITPPRAAEVVRAFARTYVDTLASYVGNERAMLYELTASAARGELRGFLREAALKSGEKQVKELTKVFNNTDRKFLYNEKTKLRPVEPAIFDEFARVWAAEGYGATLNKIGWYQRDWNDDYFSIIDIAERLESGDGSYGLARYYVLIAANENLLGTPEVILDVKQTPPPAMRTSGVLTPAEQAWYDNIFSSSHAQRAVVAQRHLTSFTDPFTGWVKLFGSDFVIRQRSPWKASFDLSMLNTPRKLANYAEQAAVVTATSHARGTVGRSPAQFKEVIAQVLGPKRARNAWAERVAQIAEGYRKQVLADYECFKAMVERLERELF